VIPEGALGLAGVPGPVPSRSGSAGWGQWRCDDDLGDGVAGEFGGAADNDAGPLPGPLNGVEGYLLDHPPALVERRPAGGHVGEVHRVRLSCAGEAPPSGLALVGLHPDQGVDQVRHLLAPGTVPFDDQQRAARGNLDGSFPAVLGPSRRAVADRPALADRLQDSLDEQVGPAEAGVLPGDVVGVNDSRSGDSPADPRNAIALRSPSGTVVVHSDRQPDRSAAFTRTLAGNGLTGSMGRVGACGDNAAMESFSALLQKNVLDRQQLPGPRQSGVVSGLS